MVFKTLETVSYRCNLDLSVVSKFQVGLDLVQACPTYGPRARIRPAKRLNPARGQSLNQTKLNVEIEEISYFCQIQGSQELITAD